MPTLIVVDGVGDEPGKSDHDRDACLAEDAREQHESLRSVMFPALPCT